MDPLHLRIHPSPLGAFTLPRCCHCERPRFQFGQAVGDCRQSFSNERRIITEKPWAALTVPKKASSILAEETLFLGRGFRTDFLSFLPIHTASIGNPEKSYLFHAPARRKAWQPAWSREEGASVAVLGTAIFSMV